jgi:hypothetical protein
MFVASEKCRKHNFKEEIVATENIYTSAVAGFILHAKTVGKSTLHILQCPTSHDDVCDHIRTRAIATSSPRNMTSRQTFLHK